MYQEGNTWYFGDGEPGPQNYRFKVVYDAGNKAETEMFTWYINEPVSNFAPVQLTYTVKLVNPKNNPGESYGRYDEDGSEEYDGLYTNQESSADIRLEAIREKGKTEVIFETDCIIYDSGRRTSDDSRGRNF